jgi:hypothetical protein
MQVLIYSPSGKLFKEYSIVPSSTEQKIALDLPSGVYLGVVKEQNRGAASTFKILMR